MSCRKPLPGWEINWEGQRSALLCPAPHGENGDVRVRSGILNEMLMWRRDGRPRPLSSLFPIASPCTNSRGADRRGQTVLVTAGPPRIWQEKNLLSKQKRPFSHSGGSEDVSLILTPGQALAEKAGSFSAAGRWRRAPAPLQDQLGRDANPPAMATLAGYLQQTKLPPVVLPSQQTDTFPQAFLLVFCFVWVCVLVFGFFFFNIFF